MAPKVKHPHNTKGRKKTKKKCGFGGKWYRDSEGRLRMSKPTCTRNAKRVGVCNLHFEEVGGYNHFAKGLEDLREFIRNEKRTLDKGCRYECI